MPSVSLNFVDFEPKTIFYELLKYQNEVQQQMITDVTLYISEFDLDIAKELFCFIPNAIKI